jgi:IS1 family transposase
MNTILRLLLEGNSIRSLERTFGVHRDTIINAMVTAGKKCERFLRAKIVGVQVNDVQVDEIWGFVGMKEKTRLRLNAAEVFGDVWCFTAIERHTKLLLTWHIGKRTPYSTACIVENLKRATAAQRFQITTDGFGAYQWLIPGVLGDRVDYATMIKVYGKPTGDDHRYSYPEVIGTIEKPVCGMPEEERICTSHVERSNKTLRMQIRRMTRLTDGHSKKWENHEAAMAFFFAYYNFCRVHSTIKMTPAQASGLTQETWSLDRLLSEASRA